MWNCLKKLMLCWENNAQSCFSQDKEYHIVVQWTWGTVSNLEISHHHKHEISILTTWSQQGTLYELGRYFQAISRLFLLCLSHSNELFKLDAFGTFSELQPFGAHVRCCKEHAHSEAGWGQGRDMNERHDAKEVRESALSHQPAF